MVQGSAMMGGALALYELGYLTGRTPVGMEETWDNYGVQEYSVKLGDKWVSYKRGDPAAMLLGAIADIARAAEMSIQYATDEDEQDMADLVSPWLHAMTDPVLNKTFMQSAHSLFEMVMQSERKNVQYWFNQQLDKLIPGSTALRHIQELSDDVVRRTTDASDVIVSKFNKKALYPRRHNIYGTVIKRDEAWPAPALGVFTTREETKDPIAQELMRLGANIPAPGESVQLEHVREKLEPKEYDKLNELISQVPLQEWLTDIIQADQYKQLNREAKIRVIKNTVSDVRRAAREALIANNKRIKDEIKSELKKRAQIRVGRRKEDYPSQQLHHFLEYGADQY
jgi:hypothetical protein